MRASVEASATTGLESGPEWGKAESEKNTYNYNRLDKLRQAVAFYFLRTPCQRLPFGSDLGAPGRDAGNIAWHSELCHLEWCERYNYRLVNRQGGYITYIFQILLLIKLDIFPIYQI